MDRDAGASTGAPWGRDVDRVPLSGAKAVKRRGVAMAQNSPWPERKYRSSPPGAWCQRPDRVDAPVDGPQAPVGRAQLHGGPAHPCHAQLASGDDAVLATHDLLLMPTVPMKATPIPGKDATPQEITRRSWEPTRNTCPINVTGHPAISLPCAMEDGRPIGMMLIGRHYAEETIYRAAEAFERSGDWKTF